MSNSYLNDDPGELSDDIIEFSKSMGVDLTPKESTPALPKEEPLTPDATPADVVDPKPAAEDPTKLLGKFNTVDDLAESYKQLETKLGQNSGKEKAMRDALAAAGYTFGEDGTPIAPATQAPAAAATHTPATQPFQTWPVDAKTGYYIQPGTGHPYDHYGVVVVTDDEWREFHAEDPAEATRLQNEWLDTKRAAKQRYVETANVAVTAKRDALKADAAKLSPELATEFDTAMQNAVFDNPQVAEHMKTNPLYVEAIGKTILGDIVLRNLPNLISAASTVAADNAAKGRKLIAPASGHSVAKDGNSSAGGSADDAGHHGLTADERTMADNFGMSYKDWAANK